jgi:hypothetical protein
MLITCRGRGGQAILMFRPIASICFGENVTAIMKEGYDIFTASFSIDPSGARLVGLLRRFTNIPHACDTGDRDMGDSP